MIWPTKHLLDSQQKRVLPLVKCAPSNSCVPPAMAAVAVRIMDRAHWVHSESAHNTSNVLKNLLVNLDLSGHRVNGIDSRGLLLCRCYLCIKKTKFICLSLMWFRNRIEFDRDEGRRVSFVLQNELIYLLWNSSNPITSVYFIYIINAVGKYEDTKATPQ